MIGSASSPRSGFTLLELVLVVGLAAVVIFKVVAVAGGVSSSLKDELSNASVEEQARIVLDRIAYQIMGADRETLFPQVTPSSLHVKRLRYRISLGVEKGQVVYDEDEEIALESDGTANEVVWRESVGNANERSVIWTRLVQPYLEGEVPNGSDDNDNGLTDEEGLVFVISGDSVQMELTLAGHDARGSDAPITVERLVTLRN